MIDKDRELLNEVLRNDLAAFIHRCFQSVSPATPYAPNWHIEAIAWHLIECAEGRIRRLIITVPPRSLKSICASVAFPAWVLGRDPSKRIICASYSSDLTAKFARDCRQVMDTDWYKDAFPWTRLNPKKSAELEFETTRQGVRYGTSPGGTLTGRGGNVIIIDDPIKPVDAMSETKREAVKQWFDSTLFSRLDDKRSDVIILVMQRVHVDDLAGYLLEKEESWCHLDLPAIAQEPQRIHIGQNHHHQRQTGEPLHGTRESLETLETLETIKANMGTMAFNAQYLQRPVPLEGNLVKCAWFRTYVESPKQSCGDQIVQSWDTASKSGELNDFSVCTTWLVRGNDYYLLHVLRERLDFPRLRQAVVELARQFGANAVLIEDKGSGTQLIQDCRYNHKWGVRPIAIKPEGDKVTRMSGQSAQIEAGQVYLPAEAPWLADFKAEILAFPLGKFDDQVDSVSQFLRWAGDRERNTIRLVKIRGF